MKFFCQLLTAYCLLATLTSCKQKIDYSKEISQLDSASHALLVTETILQHVDTGSLQTTYKSLSQELHGISEKLSADTIKKETALILAASDEQIGNIRHLLEDRKFLERAIHDSKQHIDDLKHDLAANLIEKNKSVEYIVNEMSSSQKISEAVIQAVEKAKNSVSKLDSLKTQLTFLSDSLNSK